MVFGVDHREEPLVLRSETQDPARVRMTPERNTERGVRRGG